MILEMARYLDQAGANARPNPAFSVPAKTEAMSEPPLIDARK